MTDRSRSAHRVPQIRRARPWPIGIASVARRGAADDGHFGSHVSCASRRYAQCFFRASSKKCLACRSSPIWART